MKKYIILYATNDESGMYVEVASLQPYNTFEDAKDGVLNLIQKAEEHADEFVQRNDVSWEYVDSWNGNEIQYTIREIFV